MACPAHARTSRWLRSPGVHDSPLAPCLAAAQELALLRRAALYSGAQAVGLAAVAPAAPPAAAASASRTACCGGAVQQACAPAGLAFVALPPSGPSADGCGDTACWLLLPLEAVPGAYDDGSGGGRNATEGDTSSTQDGSALGGGGGGGGGFVGGAGGRVSRRLRRQLELQLNFTLQLDYYNGSAVQPGGQPGSGANATAAGWVGGGNGSQPLAWPAVGFELGVRILLGGNGSSLRVFINGTLPPPPPRPDAAQPGQQPGGGSSGDGADEGAPELLGGDPYADGEAPPDLSAGGVFVERACAGGWTNGSRTQGGPLPLWRRVEWRAGNATAGASGAGGDAGAGGGMARVSLLGGTLQVRRWGGVGPGSAARTGGQASACRPRACRPHEQPLGCCLAALSIAWC